MSNKITKSENQSGGLTVGTIGTLNVGQVPRSDADHIYQAGSVVGRVYGGRRSPIDSTVFEFVEITHAGSLNYKEPFQYQGTTLKMVSVENKFDALGGRFQEGTIYQKFIAKVV